MDQTELADWRKEKAMTRKELAGLLGVHPMAVAYWEWGHRRIPPLLPLALEAIEHRMKEGGNNGSIG